MALLGITIALPLIWVLGRLIESQVSVATALFAFVRKPKLSIIAGLLDAESTISGLSCVRNHRL